MKFLRFIAVLLLVLQTSLLAQGYPDKSKPIKIIVPFGPGSATDLMARAIGRALTEKAGMPVIVDNKPGAESIIGMSAAKNSPPDGYTMVIANIGTQVLNVHTQQNLPYDPIADFVPIAGVAKFTNVLNASSALPFKTAKEFVEAARKSPGKYRSASATTFTRLEMELLQKVAGIELLQVPYKTMSDATTALVSGEVDVLFNDASTAAAFYKSGKVHPLGATGATRMSGLPDVPTLREQGLTDYEFTGWIAMYFPAKTPAPIVAAMRDLLKEISTSPHVTDAMTRASFEPLNIVGEQVTALQRADSERLGKLARALAAQSK